MFFSKNIMDDPNMLVASVMKYDGGTYIRPNRFDDFDEALQYYKKKVHHPSNNKEGTIFTSPEELFKYANSNDYNETLMRMKWTSNDPRCQLGIFSDNLASRLVAQFRAVDLKVNLNTKFIPISFYNSGHILAPFVSRRILNPTISGYLLADQQKDLQLALNSNDLEVKTMAQIIAIYNEKLDPASIGVEDREKILSLLNNSNSKITSITKLELLNKIYENLDPNSISMTEKKDIKYLLIHDNMTDTVKLKLLKKIFNIDLIAFLDSLNLGLTDEQKLLFMQFDFRYQFAIDPQIEIFETEIYPDLLKFCAKTGCLDGTIKLLNLIEENPQSASGKTDDHELKELFSRRLVLIKSDALRYAASNGHLDIVKYLVDQGADLHGITRDKTTCTDDVLLNTALCNAASNGHLEVIKFLVNAYSKTLPFVGRSEEYYTAIELAAQHGHLDCFQYLVNHGGYLKYALQGILEKIANQAAQYGHLEIIKYLESNNVRFSCYVVNDAATHGQWEIVKYLLTEYKGELSVEYNHELFNIAALDGKLDILVLLVNKGLTGKMLREERDIKVLHESLFTFNSAEQIKSLTLEQCTSLINFLSKELKTISENTAEIIDVLKLRVTDILLTNIKENNILQVQSILNSNLIDIDTPGSNRFTPLFVAAFSGHEELVKLFIANGAKINKEFNPLDIAVRKGYTNIVQLFLEALHNGQKSDLSLSDYHDMHKKAKDRSEKSVTKKDSYEEIADMLNDFIKYNYPTVGQPTKTSHYDQYRRRPGA